jgi:hypothetical protein
MERGRREAPRFHTVRKRARDKAAPAPQVVQPHRAVSLSPGVGAIIPFWRVSM